MPDRTYTAAQIDALLAGISAGGIASIDGVSNPDGDVDLVAGSNITITPDNSGKTITIEALGASPPASETASGIAELATQAEADAGTNDTTIMTPLKVATRPQKSSVFETHIQGLKLTWNTPGNNGNLLTVSSGSAWIPSLGRVYNVPSTITGPTQTLGASAFHYVYLYDNSGTPAIEISTTAPATAYKGYARSKTSDTSRRFIGQVLTGAGVTPAMTQFLHLGDEMIYNATAPGGIYRILNGAGPGVTNTTQSLVSILPPAVSTDLLCTLTAGTGATAGLTFIEYMLLASSRLGIAGGYIAAGSQYLFTSAWWPVNPATPSFIYSTTGPAGSAFFLDVGGYKFVR